MKIKSFTPRFVKPLDLGELSNLWHTSHVVSSRRYVRLLWASKKFHDAHPDVSPTAAYKDLDDMLSFGGR